MVEALAEKYLEAVASSKNVDLPTASNFIDNCLKQTSASLNVSYPDVYNYVFAEDWLVKFLKTESDCDSLTIDECAESCSCFVLAPYGCLPRKITDADEINKGPDSYIKTHLGATDDLRKMVQIAAYLYYNYDGGGLTDNSYDALEYHLKKREQIKGRVYEKIGAPPVDKIKVNLPYSMASLSKIKPGTAETNNFLMQFGPNPEDEKDQLMCAWSLKLDGVSGMVVYKDGKLDKIYTRGDGLIGGDVTYLKDHLKTIPSTVSTSRSNLCVVRGEFVLQKSVWNAKYKGSYSNPRSFVSGKINAGHISPFISDIQFVAYTIMNDGHDDGILPLPTQTFKLLVADGFVVVENDFIVAPTVFEIMSLYKDKRLSAEYEIDGLVLSTDAEHMAIPPVSSASPNVMTLQHTVAFKMILEDQIRNTKVINVEWNISRHGRYSPVVIYESVYVNNVRMSRATAHNAAHVRDWSMGVGTKISVIRSGDVIPQVKDVEVDESIVPIYPPTFDDGGYEWYWERSDILLEEIETNTAVMIKRVVHFFETIGVPKLRQKTAEKLHDAGMTTPESIVRASVDDFIKIKGLGKKTAQFFYDKIREVMAITPPDRFIVASSTFKSGIGRKLLKTLFRHIPDILDMSSDEITKSLTDVKIPGFGPSRIASTADGIPKFREYLDSFAKEDVKRAIQFYKTKAQALETAGYNSLIEGKKFVLTGFMSQTDYELEDYIYDHRGDFATTVTSSVEAVISGSVLEMSKKAMAAFSMGIPVLTIQEFAKRYAVPLKRFTVDNEPEE